MHKLTSNFTQSTIVILLLSFLLFFLIGLNIPIVKTIWRHSFDNGTYSHAYLIPIISGYLYLKLAQTGSIKLREDISWKYILILSFSALLLMITTNAQISIGYWLAFYLLMLSSLLILFKPNISLLFPAAFLIFVLPVWGPFVSVLQELSIVCVTYIMGYTGIPTYVEGQYVTIPSGVFEIAGGCSGLRYFIVSLAISSLYIFSYIESFKKALLFFLIAIIGALIVNWIRIAALIVIGEYTNMQSSLMEDHNSFGWYLYIPFLFFLFYIGNKLSDFDRLKQETKKDNNHSVQLNLQALAIVTFVSILSSSTIFAGPSLKKDQLNLSSVVTPIIYFPSKIQREIIQDSHFLVYHFESNELDGKPSYYANSLIPENWFEQNRVNNEHFNQSIISNGSNKAVISYRYKINNDYYSNLKHFKLARLKSAFSNNDIQLQWLFSPCKTGCDKTIESAKKIIQTEG